MRISSLDEFWPYYLSEHRHPVSRALHFFGTTAFFVAVGMSFWLSPGPFGLALAISLAFGALGAFFVEKRTAGYLPMLGVALPLLVAAPQPMIAGIVAAYACAWIGHFGFEHNRPATFRYPVWSFLCDFLMWSHMARGRWWTGEAVVPVRSP